MDGKKCIICDLAISEGAQLCPSCESLIVPNKEIIKAMFRRKPVEHKGIKYGCISAFIIRCRVSRTRGLKKPIAQVELMSGRANSLTISDPKEVKVLTDWRGANE